jgi:hypothetical protein
MTPTDASEQRYSISLRIQRITTEFAFVRVPVTSDIIDEKFDGTGRINTAKLIQGGIDLGNLPDVLWTIEERTIQPHPIQTPPPS